MARRGPSAQRDGEAGAIARTSQRLMTVTSASAQMPLLSSQTGSSMVGSGPTAGNGA